MTPQLAHGALANTCNADRAHTEPWIHLTRHETAVNRAGAAILHGWMEPFSLWESVQYQAVPRRHMKGVPA